MKTFFSVFLLYVLSTFTCVNAQNILFLPDTISGKTFHLKIKEATHQFYPGFETETFGINGSYLGPVLFVNKGDDVSMFVENALEYDTTTLHWHGLHVAPEHDGGPHTTIPPGTTWNPQFKILNNAGTYWFHPHLHEKTNYQVTKGAAGLMIIRDREEAALALPRTYGVDDIPLILQTKAFNVARQMPLNSHQDSVPLVNGTRLALWKAPAQVVRLRLLNASSDRTYLLGFSGNLPFYLIATDGGLMEQPVVLNRLRLTNGERAEILVDLSGRAGQTIQLKSYAAELANGTIGASLVGNGMAQLEGYAGNPINGKDFSFLSLQVGSPTAQAIHNIPVKLVTVNHPNSSQANNQRTITFAPVGGMNMMTMVNGPFFFNGASFDLDKINYTIPLGNTEVWTLNNQTMVAHPFHIHDVQFWLLERDGKAVPASEKGWKDVVLVSPMSSVKFIATFDDFANPDVPYMYHCHILLHEDEGMMGQFIVKRKDTAVRDDSNQLELNIYPNPVDQFLHADAQFEKEGDVMVRIFDVLGHELYHFKSDQIKHLLHSIDVENWSPGSYVLQVIQGTKSIFKKFIKR